jgi:hypothetical protein
MTKCKQGLTIDGQTKTPCENEKVEIELELERERFRDLAVRTLAAQLCRRVQEQHNTFCEICDS